MTSETTTRIGEVIESSTTGFAAECYKLYGLPPLGSLVSVGGNEEETFGIVHHATTASVEPGRRPIARGRTETSEEDIYKNSPQLTQLLRSEFSALVVGHRDGQAIRHYLPSQPVRIHAFVHLCPPETVRRFSRSLGFLGLLTEAALPVPVEEVIAATLRLMARVHEDSAAFLVAAGRELATLLSDDYARLRAILGRLEV